jgi:hypothetical protein
MRRILVVLTAALLAASTAWGTAAAQSDQPVNADGSYVVANDDGSPIVSGRGDDLIYGDINTGGAGGEVLGDPSAIYTPVLPNHPGPNGGLLVMPGAGDGMIGGVPMVPAAPDTTTTTTTNLANTDGVSTENIPVEALAPEGSAPVADETAAAPGFCAQYPSWYDAQIAYENLGLTAADPVVVQEVDPDYDGIACETYVY